jgi:hypothetical protein
MPSPDHHRATRRPHASGLAITASRHRLPALAAMALACLTGCWPPLDELTSVPGSKYRAEVLADAPLAYYRLEEEDGATTARDETDHHHDAQYQGGITFIPGAIAEGGHAANLDGTSGQIFVGYLFDFPGAATFTIEAWMEPRVIDEVFRPVVGKETLDGSGPHDGYELSVNNGSTGLVFVRKAGGVLQTEIDIGPAPSTTAFTHVVVTYDGTTATMYLNGAIPGNGVTMSTGPASASPAPFTWGANSAGTSLFAGALDELAVYDKALAPARVAAHFAAGTGAP